MITNTRAMLLAGASLLALSSPALATDYKVPAGDLKAALHTFAMQADVQIIVADDAVKGARTRGVSGEYSADAALSQILAGTGLTMHRHESGAIAVVRDEPKKHSSNEPLMHLADASPVHAAASVETVVVTSSKIKGDIQTVPIAITALSQEQLTERQIAGGPDLVKEVPNLTFSKTNFTGYNLEIRGIGTQAISVATDPAVAVAFNDTPFIRNHFFEQEFFDVSQVEVLRGPQGTLYGRNATAGVVNVVSAKPTDQFEAMLSADWGNYSNRRYEGMVNLPIVGDKLDLRIAGEWTKRDGYSFNETTGKQIDGRDLWSSRATLRWHPVVSVTANLIWEHFQESDDRLRSGKQLCKTDFGPGVSHLTDTGTFYAADGTPVTIPSAQGAVFGLSEAYFSQGCLPDSLYAPESFGVPNGFSLPFVAGAAYLGLLNRNLDPYSQTTQSRNLRNIQSAIEPRYLAKNDTLELNASWNVAPGLTLFSDTGYNHDFLWSTEDYNRFDTSPQIFDTSANNNPNNRLHFLDSNGVFCDPQLGCSDRLVVQDLAEEHSWQASQEFRLASDFKGPLNFSVGGNYLHYETSENYYVFSNTFTMIALDNVGCDQPYVPNVTDNLYCLANGRSYNRQLTSPSVPTESPQYIDPNPITRLDNNGHNYFVSQNPYVLNSYAVFGEAYYNITEDFKLTGGIRWTDDQKHFHEIPSELLVMGYGYPSTGAVGQQWRKLTGRLVANWTPKLDFTDQTMFYASYAHGYKAGGENPPGPVLISADVVSGGNILTPVHPLSFQPEFVDAYELGTKNTMLDGGLTLNGDVFFYDYTGYQISQIVDRSSINLNFDATVKGAELEATYEPLPGLKFSFAGGYEDTRIKNNQYAIDLLDRTAGTPGWVVMKPSIGQSSNCIFPEYVAAALIQQDGGGHFGEDEVAACGTAYAAGNDPVTLLPYVANPLISAGDALPPAYPGFNPATAPNNGEGFAKNVGGNQLPNAPHFTTSLTADYTMPLSANWAATLHGDFYWQSQSFARVFNDRPYDKIRGYSNVNAALILTDASGWQILGYVKNIFDTTAITGDFLNSDDSGLTTNIFLTDPRLYGIRVTKHFEAGTDDGLSLFGSGKDKPQIWLTFGGDLAQRDDGWQKFNPEFASMMPAGLPDPVHAEETPLTALDTEASLSYQPNDSDWVLKAGIRYGRSARNQHLHKSIPVSGNTLAVPTYLQFYFGTTKITCTAFANIFGADPETVCPFRGSNNEFVDARSGASENHAILDFSVGKDVGIGIFNKNAITVSAGIRVAQFSTRANAELNADPTYSLFKYHDVYDGTTNEKRSFHGIGPEVTWDNDQIVWENGTGSDISIQWGLNAAVLFGQQHTKIKRTVSENTCHGFGLIADPCASVAYFNSEDITRSRNVTVPNLGGYIGASVRYQNAKISLGYRADEFFNAMDGGQDTAKKYDRGFYGPYLNLSVGFGG